MQLSQAIGQVPRPLRPDSSLRSDDSPCAFFPERLKFGSCRFPLGKGTAKMNGTAGLKIWQNGEAAFNLPFGCAEG